MSARRRLPNRRSSVTFALEASGLRFTCSASRFDDGTLGEIFLQNHKVNSAGGIMASDSAVAASLALQYGCPTEVLRKALSRDARGDPTGPLGVALDELCRQRPPAADDGAPAPTPSPPPPGAPGAAAAEPVL